MNHPSQRENAIYLHTAWKLRLRSRMRSGKPECDAEFVSDPDVCEFGRWLGTQTRDTLPDLMQIENAHRLFHEAMGDTCKLISEGRIDEAEMLFASRDGPDFASARLVNLLARR